MLDTRETGERGTSTSVRAEATEATPEMVEISTGNTIGSLTTTTDETSGEITDNTSPTGEIMATGAQTITTEITPPIMIIQGAREAFQATTGTIRIRPTLGKTGNRMIMRTNTGETTPEEAEGEGRIGTGVEEKE